MDEVFSTPEGWEVQNLLTVGLLMTRAALARNESRGTHQRTDVPATDPAQAHHVAWSISQLDPVMSALGSAGVAAGHTK
jgi:succinate dehydrogenase/fumarate reductase flavoprotein subunit